MRIPIMPLKDNAFKALITFKFISATVVTFMSC